jgi:hypothetical protein
VGVLFDVDKSTVSRYTRPLLQLLRDRGQETLGWPEEARAVLRAAAADGVPAPAAEDDRPARRAEAPVPEDSVAIIDATAQRVEAPSSQGEVAHTQCARLKRLEDARPRRIGERVERVHQQA